MSDGIARENRDQEKRRQHFTHHWGAYIASVMLTEKQPLLPERVTKEHDPLPSGKLYRRKLGGYVPLARAVLRTYARLQPRIEEAYRDSKRQPTRVTPEHLMFILHVLDGHYRGVMRIRYGVIATRMGKYLDAVQTLARELRRMRNERDEPYLSVQYHHDERDCSFDFTGFLNAVEDYIRAQKKVREDRELVASAISDPPERPRLGAVRRPAPSAQEVQA